MFPMKYSCTITSFAYQLRLQVLDVKLPVTGHRAIHILEEVMALHSA